VEATPWLASPEEKIKSFLESLEATNE